MKIFGEIDYYHEQRQFTKQNTKTVLEAVSLMLKHLLLHNLATNVLNKIPIKILLKHTQETNPESEIFPALFERIAKNKTTISIWVYHCKSAAFNSKEKIELFLFTIIQINVDCGVSLAEKIVPKAVKSVYANSF